MLSLGAPISGGDIKARNATLTIMIGGPAAALEKVMLVFQAMGKTVPHVGEAGAGQVAMGELLIFSQKAGVNPPPRSGMNSKRYCSGISRTCWSVN